jgi:hypothetical protein
MAENNVKATSNKDYLVDLADRTPEERAEIARKGGIASGIAKREKKLMSQIYAEFLEKEHDIIGKDGIKKKLEGQALLNSVMSKVLSRGDSSAVSLMREIRQATEGDKIELNGGIDLDVNINITGINELKFTDTD